MSKPRHILGISGGKDSAALAIYLNSKYPELDVEYYFCDTGKELDETYQLIKNLESLMGRKVERLENKEVKGSQEDPFDFYFKSFRGYLPSPQARWCTALMKLKPFEEFVNGQPTVSYVGIRGDEDREGYISRQSNIQSIFPFRRNIWSNDVMQAFFQKKHAEEIMGYYSGFFSGQNLDRVSTILSEPLSFNRNHRVETGIKIQQLSNSLLDMGIAEFNKVVFLLIKNLGLPLAFEEDYPLLENEEVLVLEDIFKLLRESGVGVPQYYEKVSYEVDGQKGEYARSRSGCYFCFFQQKIEWVWLYEQHPDLFKKAMKYENTDEMFTWTSEESLEELIEPKRIKEIKLDHLKRSNREKAKGSPYLMDILEVTERDGCNTCFL